MDYKKIYNEIIKNRRLHIPSGYVEEHHILPRCLGGSDDKSNLVKLTAKEHFICHLLLTKIYKKGSLEYYKMCHAFLMMLVSSKDHGGNRYISSRKYEHLKTSFSERMSILQSGEENTQYGTMWIFNPVLKKTKKHSGEIPTGWFRGRINNWDRFFNKPLEKEKRLLIKKEKIEKYKIYYTNLYEIYVKDGWDGVLKTGYDKSQPNLVKQFSVYVENYVTQQGKKRIMDD